VRARDAVERLLVRITPAEALNDLFEARARLEAVANPATLARVIRETMDWGALLSEGIRDKLPRQLHSIWPTKLIARLMRSAPGWDSGWDSVSRKIAEALNRLMSRDNSPSTNRLRELADQIVNTAISQLGVISLSRTPTSTLMWAHYGDGGRGFLIELDSEHAFFNDRRFSAPIGRLLPVRYFDRLPPVSLLHLPIHAEDLRIAPEVVFFRKLRIWQHEREYRIAFPLSAADTTLTVNGEAVQLMALPPAALRGIVLGPRTSESLERELRAYVSRGRALEHVKVKRVQLSSGLQRPVLVEQDLNLETSEPA
jgi:hypothetical protein